MYGDWLDKPTLVRELNQLRELNISQAGKIMSEESRANFYKWFIEANNLEELYSTWAEKVRENILKKGIAMNEVISEQADVLEVNSDTIRTVDVNRRPELAAELASDEVAVGYVQTAEDLGEAQGQ